MSSPEGSTGKTAESASRPEEHSGEKKPLSKAIFIVAILATVAIVMVAGFWITIAAGRVQEDRPRDHPQMTETSSILGPPGDNSNG
ncbi:hypothetical protein ACVBEQ_19650 [Nakamurella sp. GG22]